MITVFIMRNYITILYGDGKKWLLHHYCDTVKTLKVLFRNRGSLTST